MFETACEVKYKKISPLAKDPVFASPGAAAFDLFAAEGPEKISVAAGCPRVVDTGLQFEVPEGYVLLLFSRSGHGFKNDIRLANCVGVIDSDYRGEVKVKLTIDKFSGYGFHLDSSKAIAQGMIVKLPKISLVETTDELSETERGEGGFGSTDNA